MEGPRITFHTNAQSNFGYGDNYDKISIADLDSLLRDCRKAVISFEGELMKRQHGRISDQLGEVGNCCQRLHDTSRELRVRECLNSRASTQVNDAVEVLTTLQKSSPSRTYQAFLCDILHHCNKSLVLLCAASLGKKRIVDLGSKERVSLLEYVREAQLSLDDHVLESLANEHNIPSSDSPQLIQAAHQPRKRARHDAVTAEDHHEEVTERTQSWVLIENQDQRRSQLPEHVLQKAAATESFSPLKENREMKHMCTNAPADSVSELPEPFRTAIQKSRLWRWERNQKGMKTTGCLATLFPKDNTQDVSFTIWCGNDDGYHLTNVFGLQHAISS